MVGCLGNDGTDPISVITPFWQRDSCIAQDGTRRHFIIMCYHTYRQDTNLIATEQAAGSAIYLVNQTCRPELRTHRTCLIIVPGLYAPQRALSVSR